MIGGIEVCRKCGYMYQPSVEYVLAVRGVVRCLRDGHLVPAGEHLIVSCRQCGYERLEPVVEDG